MTTVWDEMMPMVQLAQLYCAVDAFVMATHGEGWGLPLLEAMVSCLSAPCFRWAKVSITFNIEQNVVLRVGCHAGQWVADDCPSMGRPR